ncbi:MAG: thiL, partial [Rhodospirillales bacterium]|nr:thiL [Rhodospirillales bacterium]
MSDDTPASDRLGEFDLIGRYFVPLATHPGAFGLTDDGAVFDVPPGETCVVTTDAMVAGIHFFESDGPRNLGWKLLAVNLSDLAAMGATPLGYTLDFGLPKDWARATTEAWLADFSRGLMQCQAQFETSLLGGDTVSTTGPMTLAVTAFGSVPKDKVLRRSSAKAGDMVWVSGTIGDAALAVKIRNGWTPPNGMPLGHADKRLDMPFPRLALGQALRGIATAAADISDGLAADLGHICQASGVGAEIRFADVPLTSGMRPFVEAAPDLIATVLAGGDDYELVFTAPPDVEDAVRAASRAALTPVECVGRVVTGAGVR